MLDLIHRASLQSRTSTGVGVRQIARIYFRIISGQGEWEGFTHAGRVWATRIGRPDRSQIGVLELQSEFPPPRAGIAAVPPLMIGTLAIPIPPVAALFCLLLISGCTIWVICAHLTDRSATRLAEGISRGVDSMRGLVRR